VPRGLLRRWPSGVGDGALLGAVEPDPEGPAASRRDSMMVLTTEEFGLPWAPSAQKT
jgi:hypothetical protein